MLAHANGRGGGDLATEALTPDEVRFIGSWAGDRIVVAGDYDDGGLWVPDGLDGRIYRTTDAFGKSHERCFGYDDQGQPRPETLYRAAREFFDNVSDAVIRIVAKAEGSLGHPWAAIDQADDGWREVPCWGVLPPEPPRRPITGPSVWEAYRQTACSYGQNLADRLQAYLERHPEERSGLLTSLRKKRSAPTRRRATTTAPSSLECP